MQTPKSLTATKKKPSSMATGSEVNFSGIGNSIIMRKTEYYNPNTAAVVVSNKRLFSKIGGLGAGNIGNEEWIRAKER